MPEDLRPTGARPLYVVFNALSGSAAALGLTEAGLREKFAAAGLDAEIDARSDEPLGTRIARALESEAEIIVAAGGDGTITALAHALVGTKKTLAVLPLGTANLLARDLKIPLDLDKAIAGFASMQQSQIDVGDMNGRIFLHKVVIGTIPGIAAARETMRGDSSWRARFEFLRYFLRRVSSGRPVALHIHPTGGAPSRVVRAKAVAVANNSYDEGVGRFFSRERLDRGTLTLYVLRRLDLRDMVRLTFAMLAGRWRQDRALAIEQVEGVVLHMKRDVRVMIDGEVERLTPPLTFRIRPLALSILAPPAAVVEPAREMPASKTPITAPEAE